MPPGAVRWSTASCRELWAADTPDRVGSEVNELPWGLAGHGEHRTGSQGCSLFLCPAQGSQSLSCCPVLVEMSELRVMKVQPPPQLSLVVNAEPAQSRVWGS